MMSIFRQTFKCTNVYYCYQYENDNDNDKGFRMRRRKFPRHFENRILKILPDDYSKMQSTKLFNEARKPYTEIREDGKINRFKGMGPNTTSHYLKSLIKQGRVSKICDPKHPKEVHYTKCKNPKSLIIAEEAVNEVKSLLERLPAEFNKLFQSELAYYREFAGKEMTAEDEKWAYQVITEDQDVIELKIASVLIKQAQKFVESAFPSLRNKEYYLDSAINIVPKSLIDERITHDEKMKFMNEISQEEKNRNNSIFDY